jgi:hypothetical protein
MFWRDGPVRCSHGEPYEPAQIGHKNGRISVHAKIDDCRSRIARVRATAQLAGSTTEPADRIRRQEETYWLTRLTPPVERSRCYRDHWNLHRSSASQVLVPPRRPCMHAPTAAHQTSILCRLQPGSRPPWFTRPE